MTMLSEKYLAGFLDADGCIGVQFIKSNTGYFPRLYVHFSQEKKKDKILSIIHRDYGGYFGKSEIEGKCPMRFVSFTCKQARMLLYRIKKHLVIKQVFAETVLKFMDETKGQLSLDQVKVFKNYLKKERKNGHSLPHNYPTRKWLAGYFDGDGCVACSYRKDSKRSYLSARITTESAYRSGIDLINKAFGGTIYPSKKEHGTYPMLVINLDPSKALKFFGYFAKHSIVKRDQLYFVMGCAKGGNYRNGKPIKETLSQLKAQEQRLSDPDVDVSLLLSKVRFDVPDDRGIHMRKR